MRICAKGVPLCLVTSKQFVSLFIARWCRVTSSLAVVALVFAMPAMAQSIRPGWGSTPYRDAKGTGVTFRVWAPNATNVTVPGQFNGWSTTATPLAKESTNGVWSTDMSRAVVGQEYKYLMNGNVWKRDPRSRKVVRSDDNSIIYDPKAFSWGADQPQSPPLNDLVIYELHIGTFAASSLPNKFVAATNHLDYIKKLGFTAVEVLPVAEFPGDNSWGYNPAAPYAVENGRYGGPDAFKVFVQACHARGLAVLLDVVHNHYGPTDLDLWNFDGWTGGGALGGIYFYQEAGLCCTSYGSRPNYLRQPVRDYITDNFKMWLDEYHVDGFRWDTPNLMRYADGYGFVSEAESLIEQILALMSSSYPGKINIAEDVWDLNFDSTWDYGFAGGLTPQLAASLDSQRDMNAAAWAVDGWGFYRVAYLESHDVVGDLNRGVRLPTAIDTNAPASFRARKLATLGAALLFTAPGIPMLFQGQEMLESLQFSDVRPVDWSKTNTYSKVVMLYRNLIRLRRNLEGVTPGLKGEQCDVYRIDDTNKLLAYRRWQDSAPNQDVVVIANFANVIRTNYSLPFPRAGKWHVHFNSDLTAYGADYGNVGDSAVTASGSPATANVTIGPYSALILSQTPPSARLVITQTNGVVTVAWPDSSAGWILESSDTLAGQPPPWSPVPAARQHTNAEIISLTTNAPAGSAFFRLRKP